MSRLYARQPADERRGPHHRHGTFCGWIPTDVSEVAYCIQSLRAVPFITQGDLNEGGVSIVADEALTKDGPKDDLFRRQELRWC